MIQLHKSEAEAFTTLEHRFSAQRAVLTAAMAHFQDEQYKILSDGKALWETIKAKYQLDGEHVYRDGMLVPVEDNTTVERPSGGPPEQHLPQDQPHDNPDLFPDALKGGS